MKVNRLDAKKALYLAAVVSAVYLILFDFVNLFSAFGGGATGSQIFQSLMWLSVPCNLLFATAFLLHTYQKSGTKAVVIFSLLITVLYALIRGLALGLQISDIIKGVGATDTQEILALVEFTGYLVVLAANILAYIYLLKPAKGFKRTLQIVFAVAFLMLIGAWAVIIKNNVTEYFSGTTKGFVAFFKKCLDGTMITSILSAVGYLLIYGQLTDAFESNALPKGEENKHG